MKSMNNRHTTMEFSGCGLFGGTAAESDLERRRLEEDSFLISGWRRRRKIPARIEAV